MVINEDQTRRLVESFHNMQVAMLEIKAILKTNSIELEEAKAEESTIYDSIISYIEDVRANVKLGPILWENGYVFSFRLFEEMLGKPKFFSVGPQSMLAFLRDNGAKSINWYDAKDQKQYRRWYISIEDFTKLKETIANMKIKEDIKK